MIRRLYKHNARILGMHQEYHYKALRPPGGTFAVWDTCSLAVWVEISRISSKSVSFCEKQKNGGEVDASDLKAQKKGPPSLTFRKKTKPIFFENDDFFENGNFLKPEKSS